MTSSQRILSLAITYGVLAIQLGGSHALLCQLFLCPPLSQPDSLDSHVASWLRGGRLMR
jgi:hypothetical protein